MVSPRFHTAPCFVHYKMLDIWSCHTISIQKLSFEYSLRIFKWPWSFRATNTPRLNCRIHRSVPQLMKKRVLIRIIRFLIYFTIKITLLNFSGMALNYLLEDIFKPFPHCLSDQMVCIYFYHSTFCHSYLVHYLHLNPMVRVWALVVIVVCLVNQLHGCQCFPLSNNLLPSYTHSSFSSSYKSTSYRMVE